MCAGTLAKFHIFLLQLWRESNNIAAFMRCLADLYNNWSPKVVSLVGAWKEERIKSYYVRFYIIIMCIYVRFDMSDIIMSDIMCVSTT